VVGRHQCHLPRILDASLNYVGYFGKVSTDALAPEVQGMADRGYLSLNLQHTF